MTTAARPTFDPAKGGSGLRENSLSKLSQQISSRDLPGHLGLKERKPGQGTTKELRKKDFRAELEENERLARIEDQHESPFKFVPSLEQATQLRLALKAEKNKERDEEKKTLLTGSEFKNEESLSATHNVANIRELAALDVDEDFEDDESAESSDFDDDDDGEYHDDEEDDPAELLAELKRIKNERAAEEEARLQAKRDHNNKNTEGISSTSSAVEDYSESSFRVKRRWDDDVPFKNCAKDQPDPSRKRMFLNDTIRQEFHKKFMDKYIK